MDYKINHIADVVCDAEFLPDIPDLKFHDFGSDTVVFNATQYCKAIEAEFDWRTFSRINKRYIDSLAEMTDLNPSLLFYQCNNGDILISQGLTFIFLAFVNPDMTVYFNSLIADVMSVGIAFSDGFVYRLASSRLPADSLRQIINSMEDEES